MPQTLQLPRGSGLRACRPHLESKTSQPAQWLCCCLAAMQRRGWTFRFVPLRTLLVSEIQSVSALGHLTTWNTRACSRAWSVYSKKWCVSQAANCVVRFDEVQTPVSLVQSRGRARKADSSFKVMKVCNCCGSLRGPHLLYCHVLW